MFGKKAKYVVAGLSLAMALSPVAAFADDAPNLAQTTDGLKVEKVMEANEGSEFSQTFTFTATAIQLTGDSAVEKDKTPAIADVTVTADKAATTLSTDAFGFASAQYPHAGVYGYQVKETKGDAHLRQDQRDLMTYDENVYTVYVWVVNGKNGTEVSAVTAVKNAAGNAIPAEGTAKEAKLSFDNKYYEYGNPDNPNNDSVDLKVDKVVDGTQGDKTAKWTFNVSFDESGLAVTPESNTIMYQIVSTGSDPAKDGWKALPADGKYELTDGQQILFKDVVAGTKYTVTETESGQKGYTTTGEVNPATTATDKGNSATVKNEKNQTVVTGVIVNNAPFVVMIGVAVAGVAAYGAAKRKIEK